jgi:hypothetical protein
MTKMSFVRGSNAKPSAPAIPVAKVLMTGLDAPPAGSPDSGSMSRIEMFP